MDNTICRNERKMNFKIKNLITNFSYAISSNIISFIVSMLVVLIVPKVIGIEEYGYWQLYLFYAAYVAFLHLGWSDGLYLKIGGKSYNELDKKNIYSQFYMFTVFQIIISIMIILIATHINVEKEKTIFIMLAITMVITNIRSLLVAILQATNRIKEYARVIMIDRLIYIIIIVLLLCVGIRKFELLILADIIGRLISLIYSMYYCKDIIFRSSSDFTFCISESIDNIRVGIKLTVAYIASLLIIGVVRLGIEIIWGVTTFGKISFSLSISNLMMIFINAIGVLLFPILRRIKEEELPRIYVNIRSLLMILMLALLLIYYPAKNILLQWLPNYSDSFKYMTLLFPMFIYESKMAILINTYLKTLRKESYIMKINILSVIISIITTIIMGVIFRNLDLTILTIIIVLAFRGSLAEIVLATEINIDVKSDIFLESILVIIFILLGMILNDWMAMAIYLIAYCIYFFVKRKEIASAVLNIKKIIK